MTLQDKQGLGSLRSLQPRLSTPLASKVASFPRCYGPEFTSRHFLAWCLERKIELMHIEPGKPVQMRTWKVLMGSCGTNA